MFRPFPDGKRVSEAQETSAGVAPNSDSPMNTFCTASGKIPDQQLGIVAAGNAFNPYDLKSQLNPIRLEEPAHPLRLEPGLH